MLELDAVAVGVAHVHAEPVALCAPDAERRVLDLEVARRGHGVQVDVIGHDERDVVDVDAASLALEQVDDRGVVDAQGNYLSYNTLTETQAGTISDYRDVLYNNIFDTKERDPSLYTIGEADE